MFWENLKRRVTAVAIQLGHAETRGVSNIARSAYYRSATILVCTIIEGMVYELAKKHTLHNGHIVGKVVEHKQLHKISSKIFNTPEELYICQKKTKDLHIDDHGVDFGKLNVFLKNEKVVTVRQYRALESVRKERNRIHLQGLQTPDTGYTRAKVQTISGPISFLLTQL